MPQQQKVQFQWQGIHQDGSAKSGAIEAINVSMARTALRRQGVTVKNIKRKGGAFDSLFKRTQRIKSKDISAFARQMATMINAGVPVVQSLDIVAKGTSNKSVKIMTDTIKTDVEAGTKFRDALAKHPKQFSELFYSLVGVGEDSGSLGTMLERLATYQEKIDSIKRKIRKAMFYPTIVIIVAFLVATILLVKVVPEFESLFNNFGADLPAFTQLVINLSEIFQEYWFMITLGVIASAAVFVFVRKRSYKFARWVDKQILRLPVFGKLIRKAVIARFTRTLATTFSAGMPLIEALKSVAKAPSNLIYEESILSIREEVSTGKPLHNCLAETTLFPNEVVQMIAIGEETGEVDQMLNKIASIYEEEVDAMVDGLSSLLEPLIMVIIGVLVGGLVIAMYLPIFQLGDVI